MPVNRSRPNDYVEKWQIIYCENKNDANCKFSDKSRAREREKVHLNNRLFPFLGGRAGEEFHRLNKNYNEI
jgi:hypothetical protein